VSEKCRLFGDNTLLAGLIVFGLVQVLLHGFSLVADGSRKRVECLHELVAVLIAPANPGQGSGCRQVKDSCQDLRYSRMARVVLGTGSAASLVILSQVVRVFSISEDRRLRLMLPAKVRFRDVGGAAAL
jgi:hypothetical protein